MGFSNSRDDQQINSYEQVENLKTLSECHKTLELLIENLPAEDILIANDRKIINY